MKTCPTCGTTYSHRVSFCFDDGAPLIGAPEPEAALPAPKTKAPPVPLPRRGRSLLARRRGAQPVTQEHTDFGDDGYRPKALEPMAVVSRRTPTPKTPDADRTPPSADGREHSPPRPKPAQATPTPVAQPILQQQPVIPQQPTIVPPEEPAPVRASEAPTIIQDPEDDDDGAAVWSLLLTVGSVVGGVFLIGLAIAAGMIYMNDESGSGTRPEPAPIAVVPAPVAAPAPAPVVVPDPVVLPDPALIDVGTETDTEAPSDNLDPDTVGSPEPVAPEPAVDAAPTPDPATVIPPTPGPRPLPDIIVEPIPTPVPVAPEPTSPWTEVEPEPQAPAPVASAPLSVTSTPAGAAVFVNGVNLGATPFRMTMPGGSYPIELRLEGYESSSSRVVISDSSGASLNLALVALARSGPVTVTTGAAWIGAELVVDGASRGTIPASISSLEEGVHTFVLRKGGNEQTFTRTVTLSAGMTVVSLGN